MNTHFEDARRCLADNNKIGMSAAVNPIQWNLHNAIAALVKAVEEDNKKLAARVDQLEQKIRRA